MHMIQIAAVHLAHTVCLCCENCNPRDLQGKSCIFKIICTSCTGEYAPEFSSCHMGHNLQIAGGQATCNDYTSQGVCAHERLLCLHLGHLKTLLAALSLHVSLQGLRPLTAIHDWCRYTYNISEEVEQRRQAPTQMQQRIGQLLMERRQQQQHDKHSIDSQIDRKPG